jgi:hypothetical protein
MTKFFKKISIFFKKKKYQNVVSGHEFIIQFTQCFLFHKKEKISFGNKPSIQYTQCKLEHAFNMVFSNQSLFLGTMLTLIGKSVINSSDYINITLTNY